MDWFKTSGVGSQHFSCLSAWQTSAVGEPDANSPILGNPWYGLTCPPLHFTDWGPYREGIWLLSGIVKVRPEPRAPGSQALPCSWEPSAPSVYCWLSWGFNQNSDFLLTVAVLYCCFPPLMTKNNIYLSLKENKTKVQIPSPGNSHLCSLCCTFLSFYF